MNHVPLIQYQWETANISGKTLENFALSIDLIRLCCMSQSSETVMTAQPIKSLTGRNRIRSRERTNFASRNSYRVLQQPFF